MTARATTLLLLLAAVWGSSYLFIKVAVDDGLSPAFISFVRLALGAAILAPFAARQGALRGLRAHTGTIAWLGAIQLAFPFVLITVGERWISSSLAGILVASAPLFIVLMAGWIDASERSRGRELAGLGIGLAGVTLLLGIDVGGGGLELVGALLVVLASASYGAGALLLKRRMGDAKPVGLAAGATAAGAAYLAIPAALTAPTSAPSLDAAASVAALGALGTGLAFLVFYTLIANIGPARASIVAYLAPGFAVLYGAVLLGERVTPWTLLGLALVLAGSWLASRPRPRAAATAPAAVRAAAR